MAAIFMPLSHGYTLHRKNGTPHSLAPLFCGVQVLGLPLQNTEAFVMDPGLSKSPGLMFGLIWAFHEIKAGKVRPGSLLAYTAE